MSVAEGWCVKPRGRRVREHDFDSSNDRELLVDFVEVTSWDSNVFVLDVEPESCRDEEVEGDGRESVRDGDDESVTLVLWAIALTESVVETLRVAVGVWLTVDE